jgi:hypothetical protein
MPQPPHYSRNTTLFVMDGTFGRLQLASRDLRVMVDLCSDLYDVDGFPRHEHAATSLSVADAKRAHSLLERAIDIAESADDRQSCLWGDATHAVPAPPRYRSRAQPRGRPVGAASSPPSLPAYLTEVD